MLKKPEQTQSSTADSYISMAIGLAVVLVIGTLIFTFISRRNAPAPAGEEAKQEEKAADQVPANLPATHTVKEGETLWSIAESYYKSGYNWTDIAKANNLSDANAIEVGMTLTIPAVQPVLAVAEPSPTQAPTQEGAKQESYTVVKGDSLWKIAMATYGNGYKWVDIAKANSLVHPDIIHPGNVLKLP